MERFFLPGFVHDVVLKSEKLVTQENQKAAISEDMKIVSEQNGQQAVATPLPRPCDEQEHTENAYQTNDFSELLEGHGEQLAQHTMMIEQLQQVLNVVDKPPLGLTRPPAPIIWPP